MEIQPTLRGVAVREEDLEPQIGLHLAARVFKVCAAIILFLALWQFAAWWMDRPPGNVGLGVLVGDTIRLVVVSGLLWGAGDLAGLMIRTHYDLRASRILLARQTHMLKQICIANNVELSDQGMNERRHIELDPPSDTRPRTGT